jgi:hypothetical protein
MGFFLSFVIIIYTAAMNNSTSSARATDNNNISKIVINTPSKVGRIYVADGGMARRKNKRPVFHALSLARHLGCPIRDPLIARCFYTPRRIKQGSLLFLDNINGI